VTLHYPCICCGHLTFDSPPGSYDICPVCFWEDDDLQLRWPDWAGGANKPSLIAAQQNYANLGAVEERLVQVVLGAGHDVPRDPHWRPINPDVDRFEPRGIQLAPWPEDRTVLYWWRTRVPGKWWMMNRFNLEGEAHRTSAVVEAEARGSAHNPDGPGQAG
jgi:hypothetical protein